MYINSLMLSRKITKYRLSKSSGIPYTTINDICSGKTRIEKCAAETIYRIAKSLNVTMEELVENAADSAADNRCSFELYKSSVCHLVKDMGDIAFIINMLEKDEVRRLYEKKWYPESMYLLAMIDYLSRENDIPLCKNYNDIRSSRLEKVLFPAGVVLASAVLNDEDMKNKAAANSIPEFARFNIMESDVRNVF